MPLLQIAGWLAGLLSWAILAGGAYLLWSWGHGEIIRDVDGDLLRVREDWRLWVGLALAAWSFGGGRWLMLLLLARRDQEPTRPRRLSGDLVSGASGSTLYVERTGPVEAPTVILTHGWGLDSTIWGYLTSRLSQRRRLVRWDLPGLGRSKLAGDGALGLSDLAADLRGLVEEAGGRVLLVGHSIGGMTIQTFAREHPEVFTRAVAGVVLLNTTHTNPLRTMILSGLVQALRWPVLEPLFRLTIWLQPLAWLSAWQSYLSGSAHLANRLGFGRYVTRSQLEHTTLLATRNPPGVQAKGNLAMFRWDVTPDLPRLTAPTLVVAGDVDIVTKAEAGRTIAAAAPQARLEIVSGVNHMGFLERHDAYADLIEAFADTVQPVARAA